MCFNIPKKITAKEGNVFTVSDFGGAKETVRSLIDVDIDDYVLIENGVIIEKFDKNKINEFFEGGEKTL